MTLAPHAHLRTALAALALLALAAGCSSPPTRQVETHLRPDAVITFDGRKMDRDASGAVKLPIVVSYEYFQEAKLAVQEPGKPPLLADVLVLVNPPAGVEDRLAFETKANTTIVKVGEKGGSIAGPTAPVATYPDPLEQLTAAGGGPFALAPSAQGIVLVVSDWHAKVKVAGMEIPLRQAREGDEARSLPSFIEVQPGPVQVEVRRGAGASAPPYMNQVTVRPGEWRLLCVRFGDERPSLESDDPATVKKAAGKSSIARPPAASTAGSAATSAAVTIPIENAGPRDRTSATSPASPDHSAMPTEAPDAKIEDEAPPAPPAAPTKDPESVPE